MLVTGSRDWTDNDRIATEMAWYALGYTQLTLIHGACPTGADDLADRFGHRLGWQVERHPADWRRHGRRAGYIRNAEMVEAGAEVCLAFIRNNSRGATMCADLAERAGIPTHRFTEETK
jgi:hypothetical protein